MRISHKPIRSHVSYLNFKPVASALNRTGNIHTIRRFPATTMMPVVWTLRIFQNVGLDELLRGGHPVQRIIVEIQPNCCFIR